MLVPKAAMQENDFLASREHKIGLSRQILPVQPETVSHPVKHPPQGKFRRRVFRPDLPHIVAAALLANFIQGTLYRGLALPVRFEEESLFL